MTRRRGAVEAVDERAVRIVVEGGDTLLLTASPGDLDELAAGHLLAYGATREALGAAEFAVDGATVRVALGPGGVDAILRDHLRAGGVAHVPGCDTCASRLRRGRVAAPSDETLRAVLAGLLAGGSGVHGAALVEGGGAILRRVEDVGRHGAVDRVVGAAIRRGWELAELGLATTARISGAMAFKAARAGLAWIASRSVPTTLALDISALVDLPIVARAGSGRPRRFGP